MVNGRTFALGAIGGAGVSVQLALAGRAVASTGSATEEASQPGIVIRTESEPIQRRRSSQPIGVRGTPVMDKALDEKEEGVAANPHVLQASGSLVTRLPAAHRHHRPGGSVR
jgi:hypothetical protein